MPEGFRYHSPVPRVHRAMRRMGLSGSVAADIIMARRVRCVTEPTWAVEIVRSAVQNRHLTKDWKPWRS